MVRLKHRYLLVNILYPENQGANAKPNRDIPYNVQFRQPSPGHLSARILMHVIKDGVAELFGDYGAGKVAGSLQVKYYSQATSTAIVRVTRDHYQLVWAALTFTTRLPKPMYHPCVFQVVRVSGTIKKAEEEAIRRARLCILRAQKTVSSRQQNTLPDTTVTKVNAETDDADDLDFANGIEDVDDLDNANNESGDED